MSFASPVLAVVIFGATTSSARPSRDFAPAGDLLFAPPKSRQKALPCETAPVGVPCVPCRLHAAWRSSGVAQHAGAVLGPASLHRNPGPNPTHFATLRSNKGVRSQSLRLAALAPRASALLGGLEGEVPKQPTAKPENRAVDVFLYAPFSLAEERKGLRPCAKRTSRTDSARLSEQSVAARVPGGASRLEYRRAPEAQRRAGRSGGALWLLSGGPESDSPAGANSRHGTRQKASATKAPPC